MSVLVELKRHLGLKDRILFRCPHGEHDWRQTYGDERMFYGKWQCRRCPAQSNGGTP